MHTLTPSHPRFLLPQQYKVSDTLLPQGNRSRYKVTFVGKCSSTVVNFVGKPKALAGFEKLDVHAVYIKVAGDKRREPDDVRESQSVLFEGDLSAWLCRPPSPDSHWRSSLRNHCALTPWRLCHVLVLMLQYQEEIQWCN